MVRWTFINAVGGVTISAATILAATYLFVSLWRQGRGKLRVRLLQGMVISDMILGVVAIIPESIYLSNGIGLKTGSGGCDASAILLAVVVFTQHLWTLAIATATFLLLKHPLSRATFLMERYSWAAAPGIWALAMVQAGVWWRYVGWTSSGNLCYYGSRPIPSANGLDARDLIQFIPRAFVFLFIVALYSKLFSFLRRPDTIQLSSQFVSGGVGVQTDHGARDGPSKPRGFRRFGSATQGHAKRIEPVNPDAPWEQLEFVQIGHGRAWDTPVQAAVPTLSSEPQLQDSTLVSPGLSRLEDDLIYTPPALGRESSASSSDKATMFAGSSQRPSETDTLVTPQSGKYPQPYDIPPSASSTTHILKPVVSAPSSSFDESDRKSIDLVDSLEPPPPQQRRASGQTLKEFFQEHQASGLEETGTGPNGTPISATAYFNRQASLLMLYFPLAYMVVFSISLVRLIYGMVHKQPSPLLTLMSSWMVLSIGLIDGLVYGLAEFLVRRRVRRKMPDHI